MFFKVHDNRGVDCCSCVTAHGILDDPETPEDVRGIATLCLALSSATSENRLAREENLAQALQNFVGDVPRFDCMRCSDGLRNFMIGVIQLATVLHHWRHNATCFKNREKNGDCRFAFPRVACSASEFVKDATGNYVWNVRKGAGSEYMTCHNLLVSLLFRVNNDVRLLALGGAPNAVFYCIRYITKPPECFDEPAAETLRLIQKLQDRNKRKIAQVDQYKECCEKNMPLPADLVSNKVQIEKCVAEGFDGYKAGKKMLAAVFLSRSETIMISMQECLVYLLRGNIAETSAEFQAVYVAALRSFVTQKDPMASLQYSHGNMKVSSFLDMYRTREDEKSNLCIYEFAEQVKTTVSEEHRVREEEDPTDSNATSTDICSATNIVPNLIGQRIPDIRACKEGDGTTEQGEGAESKNILDEDVLYSRETYGEIALSLFVNFRLLSDLRDLDVAGCPKQSAWLDWLSRRHSISNRARDVLANMQDYYYSKSQRPLCSSELGVAGISEANTDVNGGRQAGDGIDDVEETSLSQKQTPSSPITAEVASEEPETKFVPPPDSLFGIYTDVPPMPMDVATLPVRLDIATVKKSISNLIHARQSREDDQLRRAARDQEGSIWPKQAAAQVQWWQSIAAFFDAKTAAEGPGYTQDTLPKYASLFQVARAFELNERQRYAFAILGTTLLRSLFNYVCNSSFRCKINSSVRP